MIKAIKYEMHVLINGKRATEYDVGNDLYIEGRKGSEYSVELVNHTSESALFVLSVDGLCVIDGKPASNDSRGYIVRGYSTSTIPGWRFDDNQVAKFKFGDKDQSYTALVNGAEGAKHVGVIGLRVFENATRYRRPSVTPQSPPYYPNQDIWASPVVNIVDQNSLPRFNTSDASQMYRSVNLSSTAVGTKSVAANMASSTTLDTSHTLGTVYGDLDSFNTTAAEFRADRTKHTAITLFYGDAKQLNALGIVLDWQKQSERPDPFPGDRCAPPPGWKSK